MSFSRPLVLLIVLTLGFWQYGDSCNHQKYAKLKTYNYLKQLLRIDTGYSHEHLKEKYDRTYGKMEWKRETAIGDVYEKLLCSYVFNCIYYLNLIEPLLTEQGRNALQKLIIDETNSVFSFGDKVVNMLNVLYNFGKINSLDPLWLVYMYAINLKSLDKTRILNEEDKRIRLLQEHKNVSFRLAQFTERYCDFVDNSNKYNDQLAGSDYFKSLQEIHAKPLISHKAIKDTVEQLKTKIDYRIDAITAYMSIDNCKLYFTDSLLLKPEIENSRILTSLLKDYAEITDKSELKRTHKLLTENCKSFNNKSIATVINDIAKCHNIFMNVIKYVLLYNAWKYSMEIANYLPTEIQSLSSEEQAKFYEKWWFAHKWIKKYSRKIYKYFSDTIRFLNLNEEDEELKVIAKLFHVSSVPDLEDINKNIKLQNTYLAKLKTLNYNYFNLGNHNYSTEKFTYEYFDNRHHMLKYKGYFWDNVDFYMSIEILESQKTFFTFRRFVKLSFKSIDFQVISSFNLFKNNVMSDFIQM